VVVGWSVCCCCCCCCCCCRLLLMVAPAGVIYLVADCSLSCRL
jgi:hypothetical protein